MSLPSRDDAGETAKLDQGRADAARMLARASSFVLVTEDVDGEFQYTAACDGEFLLIAAKHVSDVFLQQYFGGAEQ